MRVPDAPRVLVVDDEASMLATIEAVLEDDFHVTKASSLDTAMTALDCTDFDVVLSDYAMPGGSGLALLREVHARCPGCVGILVSGYADHPDVQAARANWREFNLLIKPYAPQDLIVMIRNAARIARLRKATQRLATQIRRG